MAKLLVFVVEDDEWYREMVAHTLSLDPEIVVKKFDSGEALLHQISEQPDVITLDFYLPDIPGEEMMTKIRRLSPQSEIIVISEQDKIEVAVELLNKGAYDYIVKSKNIRDRLLNTLQHIRKQSHLRKKVASLESEVKSKYEVRKSIIGNSSTIEEVFKLIEKATSSSITVTITGETGTGKELAAKAIHYHSKRSSQPFVAVNVAAIPHELIESELFGHEKGAFTGANYRRIGKFEEAHRGTLFLDEVGDMEPGMQVKLLRVLQEKEINRIGSNKTLPVDCRIIVATNRDLLQDVKNGRFREDLYFRLYGLTIEMPPLRQRGQDILILSRYFISTFCHMNELHEPELSRDAQQKLLGYHYPGNVRELRSVIELAVVMCDQQTLHVDDINFKKNEELYSPQMDGMTLKDHTNRIIMLYLAKHNNNIKEAARELDIGYSTIYRVLKSREQPEE